MANGVEEMDEEEAKDCKEQFSKAGLQEEAATLQTSMSQGPRPKQGGREMKD